MKTIEKTFEEFKSELTTDELVELWNEYCEEHREYDQILNYFDEDTINQFFATPYDALRASPFGEVSFNHEYFMFDGYGNIRTMSGLAIHNDLYWEDVKEWWEEKNN